MSPARRPLIIAHRGERILAPENTIASCHLALAAGATALEVDIRMCGSGEVVLFHDATLWRLFGIPRRITWMRYAELRKLAFDRQFFSKPDRICTLADFLEEFGGRVPINLDAKSNAPYTRSFATSIVATLERMQMKEKVWISSFNPLLLKSIKRINKSMRTGYLFQDPLKLYSMIDVLLESDAWHPHWKVLSAGFVRNARRQRKEIYVWTVNRDHALQKVLRHDVDGIITDRFFRESEKVTQQGESHDR